MKQTRRCPLRVTVDENTAALLEAIKARTGLSHSEQVRQSLRSWLELHDSQKSSLKTLKRS
jgi:hypothetical protein